MRGRARATEQQNRMKVVDMETVCLVHSGEPWVHQQPPCSRQMIQHLEKNEGVVTWVQVRVFVFSGV